MSASVGYFGLNLCRLIKHPKTYNLLIILAVIALSVFFALRLPSLRFDYDFEAFFPNEDNELEVFENYRKTFGYDNEFVLLALENKQGIFKKDFLSRVDSLTQALSDIPNIKKVISPTNLKTLNLGGLVPVNQRVLHWDDESLYADDSAAIYKSGIYTGSYFPANAKSLSIFIKTEDNLKKNASDTLATNIERALNSFRFDETHHVGRIFAQKVYITNLQKEFFLFICLSFCVVVIFLWLSFRSVYGVVVPVIIVLVSILWTLGSMSLLDKRIDLMITLLPTMIFIAGMSDVVHFFSKHFEELAKGTERKRIYPLILKEVGFPTFLTLLTTVVGFLSLLFSSIRPIRDFGIYTSLGVTLAFILTYTLLSALLYFFTPKKLITVHGSGNKTNRYMSNSLVWIFRHQKLILLITAIITAVSVLGIYKVRVNNVLLEDLSDKVKIKRDFMFFDNNYSGVRPFELLVTLKDKNKSLWDYEVLKELNKLDGFIKKEYGAGFLISPSAMVKNIYQSSTGDVSGAFPDKDDYQPICNLLKNNRKNKDLEKLINQDGLRTHVSGKVRDLGSIAITEHNKNLFLFIDKNFDKNLFAFEITGAAHLMDRNNEYMVSNMMQGFLFSIIVIGILTFFLHRSWRMVLVFILPNVIPLIIIGGIMGFMGIELKAATSLVFSIAFGIATDDTIHFISRLKIELAYGKSLLYAFKRTYFETGKPIIMTTFILLGGFLSLTLSDFESTFYFGFLICITVIIAVLADIFLLPVLLFLIYGKGKK
ncbi:MAG: MMPL family transporter [Bacteroidia bacterium]|nr:MMPL family transporter [Bacteroidia bacterium]